MNKKLRNYCYCALFAALLAVCSQIAIPFSVIPINLALFAIWMAGACMGPLYGTVSVCVYIALGAVGIPVFVGFKGGIQVLAGPTGGYILGYLIGAATCGAIIAVNRRKFVLYPIAMLIGCALCYAFGTAWFMILTEQTLLPALTTCVLPFIPGDVIKIALAATLSYRLNRRGIFQNAK